MAPSGVTATDGNAAAPSGPVSTGSKAPPSLELTSSTEPASMKATYCTPSSSTATPVVGAKLPVPSAAVAETDRAATSVDGPSQAVLRGELHAAVAVVEA